MSELALKLIAENKETKATFLDLGKCGLVNYLPDELGDCVWLEGLNLGKFYRDEANKEWILTDNKGGRNIFSGKELTILENLSSLQSLDLSEIQISDISFLENLTNLQALNLTNNQISDISFLENLTGLQTLDLSDNQISDINFLENLTGLQALDLRFNHILDIRFLENLTSLQSLNLSDNQISDISFLENLTGLQSLDLSENQISGISFLENLTSLQSLDLSENQISDISILENLTGLKSLDLRSNQISDYSFLENLKGLQSLYLGNNQILDYSFLENLTGLQSLDLSHNQISDICFIENLTSLHVLNLIHNQISDISFIENLTSLQALNLSYNQISDISSGGVSLLSKLTGLQSLNLSYNQISDIYSIKVICSFERVSKVNFRGNPLPFHEAINLSDLGEIRAYFNDAETGVTNKRNVKLMFVGDGCAGKSTLYEHLKTGKLPPTIDVNERTHGIALDIWSGAMPEIDIRVWDFGGQDIFHSTHRLFLGQRAVYVLVWTKQANKKCTEGEQHPLRYWLDFIADYGKESTVLLVENIIDGQFDSSQFPDDDSLEQLVEEYKSKGIRLDTTHHRIDCKYDRHKVKRFKSILQSEIEQLLENYPIQDFPKNWYAVQEELEELRIANKTIAWSEYQAICDFHKISNAKALISYLDRAGVVSYYPNLFKNQVILQTDWILEAMYSFLKLRDNQFMRLQGKLIDEDFVIVWQAKYTPEEQALFKSYMLKSEVMAKPKDMYKVNVERNYQYLIPALFPVCKPHEKIKWSNEDKYWALQFKFVYNAIIQRLQVRVLNFCHVEEEESFYQNRISFTDKRGKTAHIELLETEKELRIWAEHEELYNDILKELNDIYPLDRLKIIERKKGKEDKLIIYQKNFDKESGFNKNILKEEIIEKEIKTEPIKIFVTYCWTDKDGKIDEEHQMKVHKLVNALRIRGFAATFDKAINDTCTANDFMRMMIENIYKNDKVIIVLSEGYAIKANNFKGGVGDEYQLVINDIKDNENKYIFASFVPRTKEIYPFAFKSRDTIDLSKLDAKEIENLIRKLQDLKSILLEDIGSIVVLPQPTEVQPLF